MIAQYLGRQQRMEVASSHQVMPSQLTWLVAQPLISYSSMKVDLTLNLESTTAQPLITTTFPQKKLLRSLERPCMQCNALTYLNQWWWKTCFSPSNTADASWIMAVTCATSPCIGLPVEKECRQCRQQKWYWNHGVNLWNISFFDISWVTWRVWVVVYSKSWLIISPGTSDSCWSWS